ncbi:PAN domain-containing protein [Rhizobium laguerreae]|uniref:PAN domain-containing protein n=1 Tax=Rhizobium laguerreae TaxID=1076926 RepID=UPI0037044F10
MGNYLRNIAVCGAALLFLGVGSGSTQDAGNQIDLYLYPDTSLAGFITAHFPKSAEDCRKICSARSGCIAFDHASSDNMCRLFASVSSARDAGPGSVSGSRVLVSRFRSPINLQPAPPPVSKAPPPAPPKPAVTRCIVADPTDTPTNVRDGPNGNILTTLDDGASVVISRIDRDSRGRPWAKVYGDAEGWVFRKFLRC